jgi:hypothetical protein
MTHDLPRNDADVGEPVVPADQRNWGPGGRPEHPELVVRWTLSTTSACFLLAVLHPLRRGAAASRGSGD